MNIFFRNCERFLAVLVCVASEEKYISGLKPIKNCLIYVVLPACPVCAMLTCLQDVHAFALFIVCFASCVFYIIDAWVLIKELFQILHGVRSGIRSKKSEMDV